MLKNILKTSALISLAALTACATIVEGSTDSVNVVTSPMVAANCSLTNSRGTFSTQAPNAATVKKSISALDVTCNQPGTNATGQAKLESEIEPWDFGNLLIGGIVGISIDWISGAAYNYPNQIVVPMTVPTAAYAPAASQAPFAPAAAPVIVPAATPYYAAPAR